MPASTSAYLREIATGFFEGSPLQRAYHLRMAHQGIVEIAAASFHESIVNSK